MRLPVQEKGKKKALIKTQEKLLLLFPEKEKTPPNERGGGYPLPGMEK